MSEQKDATMETVQGLDADVVVVAKTLKLKSGDNVIFEVPTKICMMSDLVKTMADGDKEADDIHLPSVKSDVLKKVIEYMRYHVENPPKEIEKPLKSPNMTELVDKWDADFIDVEHETLFEIILASNYMDIKPLLDLACAKVASQIKVVYSDTPRPMQQCSMLHLPDFVLPFMLLGKNPEQIRKTFNIENDFTPEEEASIIAENKWAEES